MSSAVLIAHFYVAIITICSVTWLGYLKLRGEIVSEVQSVVDAVVAQLGKAKGEILGQIEYLESAVGEIVDLEPLKAIAQALDDVVPDVPVVEAPVEDAPVSE